MDPSWILHISFIILHKYFMRTSTFMCSIIDRQFPPLTAVPGQSFQKSTTVPTGGYWSTMLQVLEYSPEKTGVLYPKVLEYPPEKTGVL